MSSSLEFINYVCEQLQGIGEIRFRKMFGEYMVYVNDKPVLLICNNTVYIKKLDCLAEDMKQAACGIPYEGSREHYILDIDNKSVAQRVVAIAEKATPLPKKRSPKRTSK